MGSGPRYCAPRVAPGGHRRRRVSAGSRPAPAVAPRVHAARPPAPARPPANGQPPSPSARPSRASRPRTTASTCRPPSGSSGTSCRTPPSPRGPPPRRERRREPHTRAGRRARGRARERRRRRPGGEGEHREKFSLRSFPLAARRRATRGTGPPLRPLSRALLCRSLRHALSSPLARSRPQSVKPRRPRDRRFSPRTRTHSRAHTRAHIATLPLRDRMRL